MSNHCCDGNLAPSPNAATQTPLAHAAGERPRPAPDAPGEPRNPRDSSAGRMGQGGKGSRHTHQRLGVAEEAGVEERHHGLPRRLHPRRRALPREFETGADAGGFWCLMGSDATTVAVDWTTRDGSRERGFESHGTVTGLVLFLGQFRPNSFLVSISPRLAQNNGV